MSAAPINFACPQCHKKFSTPPAFAGKSLKCGCGNTVTVPTASSAGRPSPPQTTASQSTPISQPTPQPPSSGQSVAASTYGNLASNSGRREFPALRYVARVIDVISWFYLFCGMLGAIAFTAAIWQNAGPPSTLGPAILGAILIAIVVLLVVVVIRASAEMIRLALYVAELLEDIRQNTA